MKANNIGINLAQLVKPSVRTKNKTDGPNSLIVGRTIKKTFHYFHKSGQFIHLELPTYNKGFFYFYEKKHKTDKAALKEAMKIAKDFIIEINGEQEDFQLEEINLSNDKRYIRFCLFYASVR